MKIDSKKLSTATTTLSLGQTLYNLGKTVYTKYKDYKFFQVVVPEDSKIYYPVHLWLIKQTHTSPKIIQASSQQEYINKNWKTVLVTYVNDSTEIQVVIDGHKIKVELALAEIKKDEGISANNLKDKVVFSATSLEGQQAVVKFLKELLHEEEEKNKEISIFSTNKWDNGWQEVSEIQPRSLESVFLPNHQKESIIADIAEFRDSEEKYNRFGIPWHRGYLFYGPPGGGKTSLVKAIAAHFKMNLYIIPLSELKDSKLINLVQDIDPNSILLLEDIDVFTAAKSREETKDEVTLSGLLNALDGVTTPHGLIVIMTTNHKDKLDDALVRTGRVDRSELFDYVAPETVNQAFNYLYGYTLTFSLKLDMVSMADIVEIFKRNMDDANGAEKELRNKYGR